MFMLGVERDCTICGVYVINFSYFDWDIFLELQKSYSASNMTSYQRIFDKFDQLMFIRKYKYNKCQISESVLLNGSKSLHQQKKGCNQY